MGVFIKCVCSFFFKLKTQNSKFITIFASQGGRFLQHRKMITISIPTKTYLKKFLLHRANSQDGFITLSTVNSFGIHLLKILQKKARWEQKEKLKDYPDHVNFKIPEFIYTREGFFLSRQNIIFFNQAIKSEFEDHIFDQVTVNINREIKTTIEREISICMQFYGISESEKSMESTIKAYQRWRSERNYLLMKL